MPAYRARRTLERSLACVARQTVSDFEFVLVESGPDPVGAAAATANIPQAGYLPSEEALLPHAAINRGILQTSSDTLVFLDADAYPRPDWLERLLATQDAGHPVVVGGVACYGRGWVAQGAHLAKFDKWLPGLPPGAVQEGPTVNFLIDRSLFETHGPFDETTFHADTALCWKLNAAGQQIWTSPDAVVEHHHLQPWGDLLRERYMRGFSFANLNLTSPERARSPRALRALVSLLPGRLLTQIVRVHRNASGSGRRRAFWLSLPVTASLLYAWLLGEAMVDFSAKPASV